MRKIGSSIIIALTISLLISCKSNHDTDAIKNGTYIMEYETAEAIFLPQVTISDDTFSFAYDLLSSYWPHGTYKVKDNKLILITDDDKFSYVFLIDGDNLIFQKDESASVRLIDSRIGIGITDQAVFRLIKE